MATNKFPLKIAAPVVIVGALLALAVARQRSFSRDDSAPSTSTTHSSKHLTPPPAEPECPTSPAEEDAALKASSGEVQRIFAGSLCMQHKNGYIMRCANQEPEACEKSMHANVFGHYYSCTPKPPSAHCVAHKSARGRTIVSCFATKEQCETARQSNRKMADVCTISSSCETFPI